jgi:nucleotide-binding universal stress UspA family protein
LIEIKSPSDGLCQSTSPAFVERSDGRILCADRSSGRLHRLGADMTLEAMMVYVDFDSASQNRIAAAADLARHFEAKLIGLAAWPLRKSDPLPYLRPEVSASEQERIAHISKQFKLLEEQFRRAAGNVGRGVEWRAQPHFPREVLSREARAADLLVIGREFLPGDVHHTYDPGSVILQAGRPVLVVPGAVHRIQLSNVLIAWKDSREARRALRDALPFLKRAQAVDVVVINPDPDSAKDVDAQVADVERYLAGHGVKIREHIESVENAEDGAILLRTAHRKHAGLIVAGAYGRTRLSEWIFGGVTRLLLSNSSVPCLFSN